MAHRHDTAIDANAALHVVCCALSLWKCLPAGGVYIAGGITPRLLPHLQSSPTKGGALLEGFMCRSVRSPFKELLESMPLAVITNDKVSMLLGCRPQVTELPLFS